MAGRPKLEIKRTGRNIRALDKEWELIKEFADIVKKDYRRGEQIMNYGRTLLKGFRKTAEEIQEEKSK